MIRVPKYAPEVYKRRVRSDRTSHPTLTLNRTKLLDMNTNLNARVFNKNELCEGQSRSGITFGLILILFILFALEFFRFGRDPTQIL